MEENLTNEQKIVLLNQTKSRLQEDIYNYCICLGIDYASFDPSAFVLETPVMRHESTLLKFASESYTRVLAEIASLG